MQYPNNSLRKSYTSTAAGDFVSLACRVNQDYTHSIKDASVFGVHVKTAGLSQDTQKIGK